MPGRPLAGGKERTRTSGLPLRRRAREARASRDCNLTEPSAEEWLLIEWPEGDTEPLKYWLSTLAADASLGKLVSTAKLRWRIERDHQDSNRNSVSAISRGKAGGASIIMQASASPLTDSSSPKGWRFPL